MPNNSNNWCPEIYTGLFVSPVSDQQINVAPCCQSMSKVVSTENFDFETDAYLSSLRKKFSDGNKPLECKRCWQVENNGGKSRRQSAIEFYNQEPSEDVELHSLDFSSTWACNCACIMCGPRASSLWASELGQKNISKFQHNKILKKLEFEHLKKIHFNGGEPLMNKGHTAVLKQTKLYKTFVSYNTNGTIFPDSETIELWQQTKLIKLFFSIDAVGSAYEYIRWPAKWKDTEANLLRMKQELPHNVMFGFNVTVGAYNVFELPELIDWFRNNMSSNRYGDESDFNWQIAYNFDPASLSDKLKLEAMTAIEDYNEVTGLCNYLSTTNKIQNWVPTLDNIDRRRQTNWQKSLRIGKLFNA